MSQLQKSLPSPQAGHRRRSARAMSWGRLGGEVGGVESVEDMSNRRDVTDGCILIGQPPRDYQCSEARLPPGRESSSLRPMHSVARFLQFAGLVIPPLAMAAQLADRIKTGQMLQFLLLAVGVFGLGYLLQRYSDEPR